MNYSFYGGRRGASLLITARFSTISEMIAEFKKGSAYTKVGFDEYVLIDTLDKNDKDNGKLYRRGYSFQDDMGGAIYVGQIVGPSGSAPSIELDSNEGVQQKAADAGVLSHMKQGVAGTVPGKTDSGFNDDIQWSSVTIRGEDGSQSTVYLGFTFPYHVTEYISKSVNPYYNRSNQTATFDNNNLITRIDDETHPFYSKWEIAVPKGIKGDALKNFRVISATDTDKVVGYEGQQEDRLGKQNSAFSTDKTRQILVYDYYDYSKSSTGEPKTLYLGDYNAISDIDVADDGTVSISYTHDNDTIWKNKLKWITDVTLSPVGDFVINYNYGGTTTQYKTNLAWINDVELTQEGTVSFSYNNPAIQDKVFTNMLKWVTDAVLTPEGDLEITFNNGEPNIYKGVFKDIANTSLSDTGTFKVDYNTGESNTFTNILKWIDSITFDEVGTLTVNYNNGSAPSVFTNAVKWIDNVTLADNGTLTVSYNNNDTDTVYSNKIKWITGVVLDDDGTLRVTYNNDSPETVFSKAFKWIDSVTLDSGDEEGSGTQEITVTYNNGESKVISNPINYIMRTVVDPSNYNLLVLYSDPIRRQEIVQTGLNATYDGRNDWHNLGSIRSYSGVLIGKNYDLTHFTNKSTTGIINQLNQELPNGFTADKIDLFGKVITVGGAEENKQFFAFDYEQTSPGVYKGWYYLGSFEDQDSVGVIVGSTSDSQIVAQAETLPIGSVWMIVE